MDPTTEPPFAPERTAVVVVDMVNHQCTPGRGMLAAWDAASIETAYIKDRVSSLVVPAHRDLLAAVREAGGKVIFLRVGAYDAGYSDLTPGFKGIAAWEPRADLWGTEVLADIEVEPGDISLIKTGSGGFYTSALDSHLRNMQITTVAYTGVITNGCVMLTAAGGFDRGYRGLIVSDATATLSQALQDTAELLMDGFMANVVTTADVISLLQGGDRSILTPRNSVQAWNERFVEDSLR
ncbi:MAG: cysteine hydrolase [Acidimicrobiales bacterium]|nr:cysteine hydrolase [Acidimicrobiales bacterium]